ncbi:helix-turn-helix domain-containing protein [Microbacterium sediminis]|uniref:Transcriptional regulator n=1 Tax=Microbacterium sediminis TaxID=904291 RepID=A0A1B9ND99_9MICO|nr:helix-turn-helix transcriptional regulator [Microbacterium sediminis]OCG74576.1 transcriptional regulator [Microbacterium sediminis]QBR74874.1 XRE family transcriptional regulator [Microbacterium sediminis]
MAELIPLPDPALRRARRIDPLWRHLVGEHLRRRRHERGETLADVAERAGVSVQYLSEIERGLKEPSSEILSAVVGALDASLLELTSGIAEDLRATAAAPAPARSAGPAAYALAA